MGNHLNLAARSRLDTPRAAEPMRALSDPPSVLVAAVAVWNRGERVCASDELEAACVQRLADLEPHMAPSSPIRVAAWLAKLADGLANAPRGDDLMRVTTAITETCGDLPSGVWVAETRIAYWRASKFWPLPFDVHAHLSGPAAAIRLDQRRAETMLRLCQAPRASEPASYCAIAEVEREAAAVRWRDLSRASSTEIIEQGSQPSAPRPSPASDRALLAKLDRDVEAGRPGAAERASKLRIRMGITADRIPGAAGVAPLA